MFRLNIVRNQAGRFTPIILAAVIFTSCSLPESPQGPATGTQDVTTHSSDFYLQQMQESSDNNKFSWRMLAIQALLNEGKTDQAGRLLTNLPRKQSTEQRQEITLLQAQYRLLTNRIRDASTLLRQISLDDLSQNQLARYYQMTITANEDIPSLTLLRAYIGQEPLLSTRDEKQKNIDATWLALTHLNDEQIQNLVIDSNENVLQGWLDLLDAWQSNSHDPATLKNIISDWQARYPRHPAAEMLPTALSNAQLAQPTPGGKIALMLPLSGQAKVFSDAIERGFNDARTGQLPSPPPQNQPDNSIASGQSAPVNSGAPAGSESNPIIAPDSEDFTEPDTGQNSTETGQSDNSALPINTAAFSPVEIQRYDTTNQQPDQLVTQAQQDGATLIVGPLLKDNVEAVANSQTSLNVLALNQPANIQNLANVCYFALSPEDEARDAARHMWDQNKRQPLLLLPNTDLGDRVSKAFAREWQTLGGGTVLQQRLGTLNELKKKINSRAGIRMSGTPVEIAASWQDEPTTAVQAENTTSANGRPDSLYIVATASELQLIKPMVAMSTGSRNNIALYASSRSYQADSGTDFRFEMEGLQFSDIPLLSGANPALLAQASKYFNNDYSQIRLYAMGADAWALANHFSEMRQKSGFHINGYTGELSANEDCVIDRKLRWNQYRAGEIVPLP